MARALLDVNRADLVMIGVENLAQVVGRPVINLAHPDDRDRYLQMHRAALSGSPSRREFRIVGLTGEERWVDSHAVAFDTSDDRGETRTGSASTYRSIWSALFEKERRFVEAYYVEVAPASFEDGGWFIAGDPRR